MKAIFPRSSVFIVLPSGLYLPHGQEDRGWKHALVGGTPMPWQRWSSEYSLPFAKAQSANQEEWQRWTWTVLAVGILILTILLPQVVSVEVRPGICLCSITLFLGFFILSKLDKESHQQKWRCWTWSGRKPKPKLALLCTGGDHCHQYFGIFLFKKCHWKVFFLYKQRSQSAKVLSARPLGLAQYSPDYLLWNLGRVRHGDPQVRGLGREVQYREDVLAVSFPEKSLATSKKMKLQKEKAWWEEWKYHADK